MFGGGAQFFAAWLTDVTGSPLAPAWYMTTAVAVGLVAMVLMDESAPGKVGRGRLKASRPRAPHPAVGTP